jgi:hypothetical protein
MARTIEQTAIRKFFMALPNVAELFVLPANPPVVAFRQHTHSFDGVVHMLRKLREEPQVGN